MRAIAQTLPLNKQMEDELVESRLTQLGIESLATQKAYTLSGGERRRLEIARALVLSPDFLLLDEPFSGVDPKSVSEVNDIINTLKTKGMGILLTDHNVHETLRAVDRAYLLFEEKCWLMVPLIFLFQIQKPEVNTLEKTFGYNHEILNKM